MKNYILKSVLSLLVTALALTSFGQTPFTSGNIVVYRVSSGATLASTATAVYLDEYTTAGTLVQSIALPNTGGAGTKLTSSGSAGSEGLLNLSDDGQYITMTGYDATVGTTGIASTTSAAVSRMVAKIDYNANISLQPFNVYSGSNIRSAVIDGCTGGVWMTGGVTGITYASPSYTTTVVAPTTISTTSTNTRGIRILNGQLFYSTGSGTTGVYAVGSGLPATTGQTSVDMLSTGLPASPYGFLILNEGTVASPNYTCYISDATNSLLKYSATSLTGTWTAQGSYTAAGTLQGLTGSYVPGVGAVLYATGSATSANTIVKITDAAAYNATISATYTVVATAAANNGFRGIAFAPISNTVAPSKQASSITASNVGPSSLTLNWANGSGSQRLVYISTNPTFTAPSNNTGYGFNTLTTVGNGTSTQNQTLVYSGSGNSVSLTGLHIVTTYYVKVYEANFATDVTISPVCTKVIYDFADTLGNTAGTTSVTTTAGYPNEALSSPNQLSAGNIGQGGPDQPISNFQIATTTAQGTLSTLAFNTGGTYTPTTDFTNLKLWYNGSSNTFSGATQIGTTITTVPATGATATFSSINASLPIGTGYFWITTSVPAAGTLGKNISAGSPTLTFSSGTTQSGSISAGGLQTIVGPQNYYWNGSNTSTLNGNWDNSTLNWSSPTATTTLNAAWPTYPSIANFNGSGGGNVFLPATLNAQPTSINIGSSAYSFTMNSATTLSASSPIHLGGNSLIINAVGGLAMNSVVDGSGGSLTYLGGTTTITSSTVNSYTGGTTISGSPSTALVIGLDQNLGAVPSTATPGNIVIDNGSRLTTTPAITINANRGIYVGNNAANSISVTGAGSISTYNGIMTDKPGSTPGTWAKQGAGTFIMGGQSTYTGTTAVNNGVIQVNTLNALPATLVTVGQAASANVGTLDLHGNNQTLAGINSTTGTNGTASKNTITTTTGSSTLTINGSGTYSYGSSSAANSGTITGAVSLVMNGVGGTQTLGDANTYTGTTTVSNGSLFVNGTTGSGSAVTVSAAGTLGGSGTDSGTVSVSGTVSPGSAAATAGYLTTGNLTFNTGSTYKFEVVTAGGVQGVGYDYIKTNGVLTCSAGVDTIDITSISGAGFTYTSSYTWTIDSATSISGFNAANFVLKTSNFTPALNGGTFSIVQTGNFIQIKFTPSVPSLTPTPGTLSGLTYVFGSGPSTAQSFTLSGLNLTPGGGTITIAGSTDYEVSTVSATAGFASSATLSYTGTGTISPNTVWVRLKSGLTVASYNAETIIITGGGVTAGAPATVTVNGSVTPVPVNYYWNGNNTTALSSTWDNTTNNWSSPTATGTLMLHGQALALSI